MLRRIIQREPLGRIAKVGPPVASLVHSRTESYSWGPNFPPFAKGDANYPNRVALT